jgi:hypothetical protein
MRPDHFRGGIVERRHAGVTAGGTAATFREIRLTMEDRWRVDDSRFPAAMRIGDKIHKVEILRTTLQTSSPQDA